MYNWNTHSNFNFCEGQISAYHHNKYFEEFINSISSLFITFLGVYGLYISRNFKLSKGVIKSYVLLIICGIGSALFHSNLIELFRYLDEFPMILSSTYSTYIFSYYFANSRLLKYLLCLFWYSYCIILMALNIFIHPDLFRTLFGIPMALTIIIITIVSIKKNIIRRIIPRLIILPVVAVTLWSIDMHYCCSYIHYLYLHTCWHILIGYTAILIIEINIIFTLYRKKCNMDQIIIYDKFPLFYADINKCTKVK